ncbi:MAG: FecR domain-containing protein [Flavobacterium sp.]|nr:FecR domain-containing protein [Flavobacterium sp.]
MNNNIDNKEDFPFLSDWISGKISDSQLRELVSEEDFLAYKKLSSAINTMQLVSPNLEASYASIKNKIRSKQRDSKVKVMRWNQYVAIAAVLVLFFGLYQVFQYSNACQTEYGKNATLNLSDASRVTLNAKSKVSYSNFFEFHRNIRLEGEAYFEVAKGKAFTVLTSEGEVRVLGTKFNVIAYPDFFEICCFEGKVQVCTKTSTSVITKGMALRFYDNKVEKWLFSKEQKPQWISGESAFKALPFQYVIEELKRQYHLDIQYPAAIAQTKMTGSFTHSNIDLALQSICVPMDLHYKKLTPRKIVISE